MIWAIWAPPPAPYCQNDWNSNVGTIDCDLDCNDYTYYYLGDGWCDEDFNCVEFNYDEGDCLDDSVLGKTNLKYAKGLVAVLGKEEDNLFVTLSARGASSELFIIAKSTFSNRFYIDNLSESEVGSTENNEQQGQVENKLYRDAYKLFVSNRF